MFEHVLFYYIVGEDVDDYQLGFEQRYSTAVSAVHL